MGFAEESLRLGTEGPEGYPDELAFAAAAKVIGGCLDVLPIGGSVLSYGEGPCQPCLVHLNSTPLCVPTATLPPLVAYLKSGKICKIVSADAAFYAVFLTRVSMPNWVPAPMAVEDARLHTVQRARLWAIMDMSQLQTLLDWAFCPDLPVARQ